MKSKWFKWSGLSILAMLAALLITSVVYAAMVWGTPITVMAGALGGTNPSLTVVNGNPAISFVRNAQFEGEYVVYVRAKDASGTAWGTPQYLDNAYVVGGTSLAVVNGNPAISYSAKKASNFIMYIRAEDANGKTWSAPVTVENGVSLGNNSLVVVNGNPAMIYRSYPSYNLMYVRATDPSGAAWGAPVVVVGTEVEKGSSLAVVNGNNPAISFYSNHQLKYVRAMNASGTVWGPPITVDGTGDVGEGNMLVMVNGHPAISYYDTTNSALKYVRATDASGTTWGAPQTLNNTGDIGSNTSLTMVNGFPAISYFTNHLLKYMEATDLSGSAWDTPQTLDSARYNEFYYAMGSMTVVSGTPAISYFGTTGNLKYVQAEGSAAEGAAGVTSTSIGSQDGWVLESANGSKKGGSMDAASTSFQLGDDNQNRQYRAILSFNTASLPDNAIIKSAVLKIKQSGAITGSNPFNVLGSLFADIKKGFFGSSSDLQLTDFNATASARKVATFGKTPASGWYTAALNLAGRKNINKTNMTQFRLYFSNATNADGVADFMEFFSGNYFGVSSRPQLIITYTMP